MKRYFNIEGSCHPDEHYMVDLEQRLDEIKILIDNKKYCNYSEGAIHKMPEYTYSLKLYILAGHFVHDAVTSYELICATCTL